MPGPVFLISKLHCIIELIIQGNRLKTSLGCACNTILHSKGRAAAKVTGNSRALALTTNMPAAIPTSHRNTRSLADHVYRSPFQGISNSWYPWLSMELRHAACSAAGVPLSGSVSPWGKLKPPQGKWSRWDRGREGVWIKWAVGLHYRWQSPFLPVKYQLLCLLLQSCKVQRAAPTDFVGLCPKCHSSGI